MNEWRVVDSNTIIVHIKQSLVLTNCTHFLSVTVVSSSNSNSHG